MPVAADEERRTRSNLIGSVDFKPSRLRTRTITTIPFGFHPAEVLVGGFAKLQTRRSASDFASHDAVPGQA